MLFVSTYLQSHSVAQNREAMHRVFARISTSIVPSAHPSKKNYFFPRKVIRTRIRSTLFTNHTSLSLERTITLKITRNHVEMVILVSIKIDKKASKIIKYLNRKLCNVITRRR